MKCHCEQGLDNRIKRLCEHHERHFALDTALMKAKMGRLEAENDILRGLIEIKHILEGVKAISPVKVVKKAVKK